jgi:hypothetical protein
MGNDGYYVKVAVDFYPREDGGLRATSSDVPELVLSSPDPDALLEDVGPAIEHIMKLNHGVDIEMRPLTAAKDFLVSRGVISKPDRHGPSVIEFAGRLRAA